MMAMAYGDVYVAQVALALTIATIRALTEAENYDGPSILSLIVRVLSTD